MGNVVKGCPLLRVVLIEEGSWRMKTILRPTIVHRARFFSVVSSFGRSILTTHI
jgi:hypothetical protein